MRNIDWGDVFFKIGVGIGIWCTVWIVIMFHIILFTGLAKWWTG